MRLIDADALKAYARKVLCKDNPTDSLIIRLFDNIIDNTPSDEIKSTKDLINSIASFDVSGIKPLPEYKDGITDVEQKDGAEND